MNFDLIDKIGTVGADRYRAYIKSIVSGDGSVVSRMASGPGGAMGPWDRVTPELKELAKKIISELPADWTDKDISDAVLEAQGLLWNPEEQT
jgi:hypothetical protein